MNVTSKYKNPERRLNLRESPVHLRNPHLDPGDERIGCPLCKGDRSFFGLTLTPFFWFCYVKGIYSEAETFHGDSFYRVSGEKGQLPGDTCLPLTHGTANLEDRTKKLLECRPDTRSSSCHSLPTLRKRKEMAPPFRSGKSSGASCEQWK